MRQSKKSFVHESLQDAATIQALLESITKGIAKGRLSFSDEDGEIVLKPGGLLNLKLSASQDELRHRLSVRVTWQGEEKVKRRKSSRLKTKAGR